MAALRKGFGKGRGKKSHELEQRWWGKSMYFATKKNPILTLGIRENNRWKMILNCAKIRAKGRWRIFETPEFMDPISTVLQVMTGYRKKKKKKEK